MARRKNQPKRILLRDFKVERDEDGKVISITGKCAEKLDNKHYCPNSRQIAPQDAFQVARCKPCQRKLQHRKIAAKRKLRRAQAARLAKKQSRLAQNATLSRAAQR